MADATLITNTTTQPNVQETMADAIAIMDIEIKEKTEGGGEVKAGQPTDCCQFTDFQCWLFKEGKCVYIFNMKIDSTLASMLLSILVTMLLLKLFRSQ